MGEDTDKGQPDIRLVDRVKPADTCVHQTVDAKDGCVYVVVEEAGLRKFVVAQAVKQGLVPASGEPYLSAVEKANKRVHLLDTSPFAYLTWLSNQEGFSEKGDKIRDFALDINNAMSRLGRLNSGNFMFRENVTGEDHLFVHLDFDRAMAMKGSRKRDGLATNCFRLYLHEVQHLVQTLYNPDICRKSDQAKSGILLADQILRLGTLGTLILLDIAGLSTDRKLISDMVAMGVAVASPLTPVSLPAQMAVFRFNPKETEAYRIINSTSLSEEDILGISIEKGSSESALIPPGW